MTAHATFPGVSGVVGLANDPLRGHLLTVDGKPAAKADGAYLLPGEAGEPVRATLKGRFLSSHPVVVIDGREYYTGAPTAPFLRFIAFMPLVLLLSGSIVPAVLGLVMTLFCLWIMRLPRSEPWKAVVILCTVVAGVVFSAFWAFFAPWVAGLFRR